MQETPTNNHSDRPHAEFGPSSLKHIHECPGWESRGGTNEAAEAGTRIHEAVEARNPVSLHSEDEVRIYEALVRDEETVCGILGDGYEKHIEIRLDIQLPYGCSTFGTADLVGLHPSKNFAVLHDHKTGIGRVDAPPENFQSTAYAIGVFQRFPQIHVIHASFSLPRREELLVGVYERAKLDEYIDRVGATIFKAKLIRPKWATGTPAIEDLNIGGSCRFCKHMDRCPALGHLAFEIANRYDPDRTLLPEGPIAGHAVEDPTTLAELYRVAKIVEKWADGVKFKAINVALSGTDLPGLRTKTTSGSRKFADKEALYNVAGDLGITQESLLELAEIPYTKLRDFYAARAPNGQKSAYANTFDSTCEFHEAVVRSAERVTLVEEQD